jgi:pyrimidine-nucleoside phosphorylase
MRAVDIIRKKRDGQVLSAAEIEAFVRGATDRSWPEYQVSALLMAIVLRGMDATETATLTGAMVHSGVKIDLSDLPGIKVGKHSTGGVGDKLSLVVVPLAAACGVVVPKMSGRGLGHTGGTLDKLESIPGYRVSLSLHEFRAVVQRAGCALIGPTKEIAPADKALYALRDVTGTVESIPLVSSSIMSKKIAEGNQALVLDVKCGRGAFMKTRDDARRLAESLVNIGTAHGVRTEAVLTAMDRPLGRAIGNTMEIFEAIMTLEEGGPEDVTELSVHLAARMVRLGGVAATLVEAEARVRDALTSRRGLDKFREIITHQGGDPRVIDEPDRLPKAPHCHRFCSPHAGFVTDIDAEKIGRASVVLGAGRNRVEDTVDPAAGVLLLAVVGEKVKRGELLAELYYSEPSRLPAALALVEEAYKVGDEPAAPAPLVLETIEA